MKDIELLLKEKKEELEKLEIPIELETRLNKALNSQKPPRKKQGLIGVALIMLLLFSYNFDAIAYYGKQFMGYDEVIHGALKNLNEMGQGQVINKSHIFSNGIEVTLEGIMVDDNQLIAFYSIKDERGNIDDVRSLNIKGIFNYHMSSGSGIINESETEIKWVGTFEPPKFFERNLKFQFAINNNNTWEQGEIEFELDRSKAMGTTIKQSIKEKLELGDNTINFATITASPTVTVIEGSIDTKLDLYRNSLKNTHPDFKIDFDLYANNEQIEKEGMGLSSSLRGYTFEGRFEALPQEIDSLAIKVVGITSSKPVDKVINLDNQASLKFSLLDREVLIKKIYSENDATYLTIVTEDDVLLEQVSLIIDEKEVPLERTISSPEGLIKNTDGSITFERTLMFMDKGDNLKLKIGKIRSFEEANKTIEIPLD